jgi:hypothetical protein
MIVTKKPATRRGKERLLYNDNEGVILNGTLIERTIFYIDTFENVSGVRGRGKRLLCYVINDIMQNHPDIIFIQLTSVPESQEPIGSKSYATQQLRLNRYYEGLGFVHISPEASCGSGAASAGSDNEFVGDIATLHKNACK